MKNHILTLLPALLISFTASSEVLQYNPLVKDYSYSTFNNVTLPLDANIVNVVFQDDAGLIWFGTKSGLYSYNGYDLHGYYNDYGVEGNSIYAISRSDNASRLYIGSDGGVLEFDTETGLFKLLGFEHKAVRSLGLFDGNLWVGSRDEGLFRLCLESGVAAPIRTDAESTIYSIIHVGDELFTASYEHFCVYDIVSDSHHVIDLEASKHLMVNSLLYDARRNCVWVGTEGYLYRYSISSGEAERMSFLEGNSFKTMAIDSEDNLLLGTDVGLFVYSFVSGEYKQIVHDSRNPKSLCNNIVWNIFRDRNSNIWLATDRGVSMACADEGLHYVHLSEIVSSGDGNLFTHIMMDSRGDYWLGGENGLIYISGDERGSYSVDWFRQDSPTHPIRHSRIRHVFEDRSGDIWIATDGGVGRYDRGTNRFHFYPIHTEDASKNANWAYSIADDDHGRLWIASYMGGLFVCDKDTMAILYHFDDDDGIGNKIYELRNMDDSLMWVRTCDGLFSFDLHTMQMEKHNLYPDNMICVAGGLWYSFAGRLFKYDTVAHTGISLPFSVNCRQIYSFFPEGDKFWFTSSAGVFRVDCGGGQIDCSLHASDYNLCGLYDESRNEIVLGGEDGITRIAFERYGGIRNADTVSVSSLVSGNELMRMSEDYSMDGRRISLRRRENVTMELSSYSYRSNLSFYFKVNDAEWQSLGEHQNHLPLVNLHGGMYEICLSCSNPELNPGAVISSYVLVVPYPWFLNWKMFIVYAFVLGAGVWLAVRAVRRRNREELERQERERSLELSNMKTDFFVNISHELKTPLSLIIAPVSKMLSETTNAKQKERLAGIRDNALRLNALIHKVMDFKQLEAESGDMLIRSHVEMNSLIRNCISMFASTIEDRGLSVGFTANEDPVWANLDAVKIESVMVNLLSNAIKYIPDGSGVINIGLKHEDTSVNISISDNGVGIDKDELSLVFVRFFQGKNRHLQSEGTGVGLYLVKKFVELHGGSIGIESDGGVTVSVSIPLVGDNICISTGSVPETVGKGDKSWSILIVDDNKEIVDFLYEAFSAQYDCRVAYDGENALALLGGYTPDLVIVDQMMPRMDGLSFVRRFRKEHKYSSVPIIMLTAKDDLATELESIKAGVDIFMPKPFDMNRLHLRVAQLLAKRDLMVQSMHIEASANPDFEENVRQKSADEIFMERITILIEENMENENFRVSTLADMMAVDDKQLYRKVKQLTGDTPVNYMRKLRMKKAAVLLRQDRFTVSEVMYLVGYSNSSYFSKCFSKEFGMNPKEFASNERHKIDTMSD